MKHLSPIHFLSVCSGIEAASVAWEPFGWRAQAVSEIDPFACHVLHHRHGAGRPMFMPDPDAPGLGFKDRRARASAIKAMGTVPEAGRIPNFGDMTQFKEWPDANVSILVGGTPCQSFSVAGLRRGLDDPRGNLALTYLAIADRYRPEWVVWENVPGVLSSNGGRDFGAFLGGLVQLGYGFAYRVLDAQHVRTFRLPWAVPQRRRRVFVVGYLGDWRPAAAVLFDGQSLRGDPAPRRKAGQGFAGVAEEGTRGRSHWDGSGVHPSLNQSHNIGGIGLSNQELFSQRGSGLVPGGAFDPGFGVCGTLSDGAHMGGGLNGQDAYTGRILPVAHTLRGEGFDATEDGSGRGTPLVPVEHPIAIQERAVCENANAGPDGAGFRSDGAAYTLEARTTVQAVAFDSKATHPQALEDGSSPTLRAMGHADSHANAGGQLAVAFDAQAGGNTGLAVGEDVAGALHSGGKHGGRSAVAFAENSRGELRLQGGDGQIAPQLTTGGGKPGQGQPVVAFDMRGREGGAMPEGPHDTANIRAASGGSSRSYLATRWAVRRLTPLECERLQGFPDGFTDVPYRGRNHTPDGPRYKALGNSMACNVMEWIGHRIQLVRAIQAGIPLSDDELFRRDG